MGTPGSILKLNRHFTSQFCLQVKRTHAGMLDSGYVREHFETKSTFHFTVLPIGKAHSRWQVGQCASRLDSGYVREHFKLNRHFTSQFCLQLKRTHAGRLDSGEEGPKVAWASKLL